MTGPLALAQKYPTKPVRLIDPFGVGGGSDLTARALASKLSEFWGQPATVENHPGSGSTAGPALVARSPQAASRKLDASDAIYALKCLAAGARFWLGL
jgi:tripartite-type tricarboxylate transporter receptor subunit TctC